MSHQFQLALYDGDYGPLRPIKDYLQTPGKVTAQGVLNLESTLIILETQGKDWLSTNWNLGSLNLLVLEFEAAWERLSQGQEAIIRSAVDDEREVPYLLLEPSGQNEIAISMFFMADTDLAYYYPIPRYPGHAEKLYEYVKQNRSQLLNPVEGLAEGEYFKLLPYPYTNLMESLKGEAERGRQLYELLEEEFHSL